MNIEQYKIEREAIKQQIEELEEQMRFLARQALKGKEDGYGVWTAVYDMNYTGLRMFNYASLEDLEEAESEFSEYDYLDMVIGPDDLVYIKSWDLMGTTVRPYLKDDGTQMTRKEAYLIVAGEPSNA